MNLHRLPLLLVCLVVLSAACRSSAPVAPSPAVPTHPAATSAAPTAIPPTIASAMPATATVTHRLKPTGSATPSATPQKPARRVSERPLSADGPWLLVPARDGLWIANGDGSGLTRLAAGQILNPQKSLSPDGRYLAYTAYDSPDEMRGLALYILELPGGEVQKVSPLSPKNLPAQIEPGSAAFEALRGIHDFSPPVWSPDGSLLAFMGAQDGPSSDLYVFSLTNREIRRLTDGPSQGYAPAWSPDGKWIVHTGAETFGTGAGFLMNGIWAANPAGKRMVKSLYDPAKLPWYTSGEQVLGWVSEDTFVVNSWDGRCGAKELRTVSVETGKVDIWWPYSFWDPSLALDPDSGVMMFQVIDDPECSGDNDPGVYRVQVGGGLAQKVAGPGGPIWSPEAGLFILQGEGYWAAFTPQGEQRPVWEGLLSWPAARADGKLWAAAGDYFGEQAKGLWVGPLEGPMQQVSNIHGRSPFWAPDGQALFFFAGEDPQTFRGPGMYVAYPPDYEPVLLNAEVERFDQPFWAGVP